MTTVNVIFTQLDTKTTFSPRFYGTPMGINTVTWYQAIDKDTNADLTGWIVSRRHAIEEFVINGPSGLIHPVDSLPAAAEFISHALSHRNNA